MAAAVGPSAEIFELHGIAVALDLTGAGVDQHRGDFSLRFGAGAGRFFSGFDGALTGGDEAIDGAQRCAGLRPPVPAAGMPRAWAAAQRLR